MAERTLGPPITGREFEEFTPPEIIELRRREDVVSRRTARTVPRITEAFPGEPDVERDLPTEQEVERELELTRQLRRSEALSREIGDPDVLLAGGRTRPRSQTAPPVTRTIPGVEEPIPVPVTRVGVEATTITSSAPAGPQADPLRSGVLREIESASDRVERESDRASFRSIESAAALEGETVLVRGETARIRTLLQEGTRRQLQAVTRRAGANELTRRALELIGDFEQQVEARFGQSARRFNRPTVARTLPEDERIREQEAQEELRRAGLTNILTRSQPFKDGVAKVIVNLISQKKPRGKVGIEKSLGVGIPRRRGRKPRPPGLPVKQSRFFAPRNLGKLDAVAPDIFKPLPTQKGDIPIPKAKPKPKPKPKPKGKRGTPKKKLTGEEPKLKIVPV